MTHLGTTLKAEVTKLQTSISTFLLKHSSHQVGFIGIKPGTVRNLLEVPILSSQIWAKKFSSVHALKGFHMVGKLNISQDCDFGTSSNLKSKQINSAPPSKHKAGSDIV